MTVPVKARLLVLDVGSDLYALDVLRVREVLRNRLLLPGGPGTEAVAGMLDLRSAERIPVIDLGERFGDPVHEDPARRRIVVCLAGGQTVGLLVDAVIEILEVAAADLCPYTGMSAGCGTVVGFHRLGDKIVLLLDPRCLTASTETVSTGDIRREISADMRSES